MNWPYVCISLLLCLTITQSQSRAQEVAQAEKETRSLNQMTYTNIKTYTFLCGRHEDFVLKPSLSKEVKIELNNYWRRENVYVSAEYRQGEDIRVIVYENDERVLLNRKYYMTTGLTFQVKTGSYYVVRFLTTGEMTKLVSMIVSSPLHIGDDVATKEHIESAQEKVETIGNQLKAMLTISQRNNLMKEQLGKKIVSNTKAYMIYQLLETFLIVGVAVVQVVTLTRILKAGSIV